jgi:hypothetical protein
MKRDIFYCAAGVAAGVGLGGAALQLDQPLGWAGLFVGVLGVIVAVCRLEGGV